MKRHLLRWVGVPLLVVYSAALVVASVPDEIAPGFTDSAREAARRAFDRVHLRAGSFVFRSNRGKWKRKSFSFAAFGERKDGRLVRIDRRPEAGVPQGVRLFHDPVDTLTVKLLGLYDVNRLMRMPTRARQQDVLERVLRSRVLDRMSRYYCRSDLVENDGIRRVYLAMYYAAVNYETGAIRRGRGLAHAYNCTRGGRIARPTVEVRYSHRRGLLMRQKKKEAPK